MTTSITEVPVLPSGSFTGSRLFSKIARSPTSTRRHRGAPSQDIVNVTQTQGAQTQGAQHSQRQQRPGYSRQISASEQSQSIQRREEPNQRHNSDASSNQPKSRSQMSYAPLVSEYYLPSQVAGRDGAINYMFQQMYELIQKRIATLQYMRRAYDGKLFWLNTAHLSKRDIEKLPSHMPNKLARRATNFFLLGISIPTVLDVHAVPRPGTASSQSQSVALEYLKSLNTLLAEFESYQEKHPVDGSHPGSLSRARLPSMFKRSTTTSRPRKSSSAPSMEIGSQISPPAVPDTPHHMSHPSIETAGGLGSATGPGLSTPNLLVQSFSASATFPPPGSSDAPNSMLLPHEAPYTHLLTPPIPFSPDFYSVFITLCEVLIETYEKFLQIVTGPTVCTATVMELFSKTDARIRKVMVGGIVREFEIASRENAKRELASVQKVVLGGLVA